MNITAPVSTFGTEQHVNVHMDLNQAIVMRVSKTTNYASIDDMWAPSDRNKPNAMCINLYHLFNTHKDV